MLEPLRIIELFVMVVCVLALEVYVSVQAPVAVTDKAPNLKLSTPIAENTLLLEVIVLLTVLVLIRLKAPLAIPLIDIALKVLRVILKLLTIEAPLSVCTPMFKPLCQIVDIVFDV